MKFKALIIMAVLATGCHVHNDNHHHDQEQDHGQAQSLAHTHSHEQGQSQEHNHLNHSHSEHSSQVHDLETKDTHMAEADGHKGSSSEIVFDEHRQELFGVKSEKVSAAPFSSVIHVGGEITGAPGDDRAAVAPSAGMVHFAATSLTAGSPLSDGQVLAYISSASISGGDQLTKLKAGYEAAKAEYLRDSALVQDNIIQRNHYEQSRLAYVNAKTEYEAVAGSRSGRGIPVKISGKSYLRSVNVAEGEYVEAGQTIAVLTKGSTLSLVADVPARHAAALPYVRDARFSTPDGRILTVSELGGKLSSRARRAEDGYLSVSFELPDRGSLVSGCFSEVWLISSPDRELISLPLGSIIEEQGVSSVFVRLDGECFEKREVRTGRNDGLRVEILQGLKEGEEVVTEGAIHIRLASVSAVPAGHSHSH